MFVFNLFESGTHVNLVIFSKMSITFNAYCPIISVKIDTWTVYWLKLPCCPNIFLTLYICQFYDLLWMMRFGRRRFTFYLYIWQCGYVVCTDEGRERCLGSFCWGGKWYMYILPYHTGLCLKLIWDVIESSKINKLQLWINMYFILFAIQS